MRKNSQEAAPVSAPTNAPVAEFGELTASHRMTPEVWEAETLGAAWQVLHTKLHDAASIRGMKEKSPSSTSEEGKVLEKYDLVGLAKASSMAELQQFLRCFPPRLRDLITQHPDYDPEVIEEVFVHSGQFIELTMGFNRSNIILPAPTLEDIRFMTKQFGRFGVDGRGCIPGTLHRVSRWASRNGSILGFTMRVGRYMPNASKALLGVAQNSSVLLLSKPGAGKTTVLRDLAVSLSRLPSQPRVLIIDTSNEIGGDSDLPLPYLGRARRLQVPSRGQQLELMNQALTNHTPDYVIIDEVATEGEAQAAWAMCQRGVKLIATAHGETLAKLVANKELNILVGGVAQAFLSNEERRLRSKLKKTILERPYNSPFGCVCELVQRGEGMVYTKVNDAVDAILDDQDPRLDRQLCTPVNMDEEYVELTQTFSAVKGGASLIRKDPLPVDQRRDENGYIIPPPLPTQHTRQHPRQQQQQNAPSGWESENDTKQRNAPNQHQQRGGGGGGDKWRRREMSRQEMDKMLDDVLGDGSARNPSTAQKKHITPALAPDHIVTDNGSEPSFSAGGAEKQR